MPNIANPRRLNPTRRYKKNIITARKGTIPQAGAVISVPQAINNIKIKNTHASNSFGINFNDDLISNYWTVKPNEILELNISEFTVIKVKGIGGDSSFEAIVS